MSYAWNFLFNKLIGSFVLSPGILLPFQMFHSTMTSWWLHAKPPAFMNAFDIIFSFVFSISFLPLLVPHEHINFYIHFHSWLFCLPFSALPLVIIWKQILHHVIPVSCCLTILCRQWFYIFIVLFLLPSALWLFSYISYNLFLNVLWIFSITVLLQFFHFPYCFMILYHIGSVSSFLSLNQYISLFTSVILSCGNNISLYLSLDNTVPHAILSALK